MSETMDALQALEKRLAENHLRGQWQQGATRPQKELVGDRGQVVVEPMPTGIPYVWKWADMLPLLEQSIEAMNESYTARRSLVMINPENPRGTTHTMIGSMQIIRGGETAWAHRHSINALRFIIQGSKDAYTVVDGEPLTMEPYDLLLTPGGHWHDHHNETDTPAIWLDGLDVPFMVSMNQIFYEELGETVQNRKPRSGAGTAQLTRPVGAPALIDAPPPFRYAWNDIRPRLELMSDDAAGSAEGVVLEYINPHTGGPAIRTISCRAQLLPPGFEGARLRRTSSAIYFVIGGEGGLVLDDRTLDWVSHDTFAVPNWTWHRLVNRSEKEPAFLFSMHDIPMLSAFGLQREEIDRPGA